MNDSLSQQKEKSKEKYNFERSLLKTLPKCIELNLIAKEFKKNVSMSVKMMLANEEDEEDDLEMKKRTILIKVINREAGYSYWWDTETLSNRYYIIKDMSEQYFETGVVPALTDATDPFWDPQTPTLIGRGFLTTKALAYMFDNPASLPIIGEDEHCGELIVNLVPTDDTGTRNLCEEMDEEEVEFEPEELIDKPLHYLIVVTSARIPTNYKDIFVEYQIRTNEHERQKFRTDTVKERTNEPRFNYTKLHKFDRVTAALLDFLTTAKITFKVYGCEVVEEEKKTPKPPKTQEPVEPDVEKAKKEDLKKLQRTYTMQPEPQPVRTPATKPPAAEVKKETKREGVATGKSSGSATNNTVGERNQKNAKEKDCEIY